MGEDRQAAGAGGYEPVLGLAGEPGTHVAVPGRWVWAAGTVFDQPEPEQLIELTVVVPTSPLSGVRSSHLSYRPGLAFTNPEPCTSTCSAPSSLPPPFSPNQKHPSERSE